LSGLGVVDKRQKIGTTGKSKAAWDSAGADRMGWMGVRCLRLVLEDMDDMVGLAVLVVVITTL
jgi:hypothetical protein